LLVGGAEGDRHGAGELGFGKRLSEEMPLVFILRLRARVPGFQPPAAWRERSEALRHLSALASAPLPAGLESQLRPYQRLGTAWLWHRKRYAQ